MAKNTKKKRSPVIVSMEQAQERMRQTAAKQVAEFGRIAIDTFKSVAKSGDETRSRVPAAAHLAQMAGLINKGSTVKATQKTDGKMEVIVTYEKAATPEEDD